MRNWDTYIDLSKECAAALRTNSSRLTEFPHLTFAEEFIMHGNQSMIIQPTTVRSAISMF